MQRHNGSPGSDAAPGVKAVDSASEFPDPHYQVATTTHARLADGCGARPDETPANLVFTHQNQKTHFVVGAVGPAHPR